MNLGTAVAYLDLNTSKWDSGFSRANQQLRTLSDSTQTAGTRFQAAGQLMQNTGRTLTMAVTLPVAGIAAASVKTAAEFEASMSKVQAVSGASGQDMQKLEKLARDMGATTKFSASDAADALNYMGMAGWKTQDMMNGLPGVLDLAAAGGTDLALTSDIVTDGLTGLGLTAKDTGMFVDVMAATMSNSNTNVELMGESLKYVGPVAGALGIDMKDLSLAIGLMGNSGIKGSQAGTALRAGLTNLIKPTSDASATMEKYGIEVQKNADGSVDFMGTMNNLRSTLGGLDETTQAAALSTIFGKEAMSGWAAIVNASEGDFNKLSDAIQNSDGKAKDMATTMQDNLKGQLDNLKSALEEAAITIGNALMPALKKLVEWLQKATDWFNQLSPSMKNVVLATVGIAAAIGPLLLFFGSLALSIQALLPVFSALGTAAAFVGKAFGALGTVFNLFKFLIQFVIVPLIRNTLIPAFQALWGIMLANPVGLVIAAIGLLVGAFIWCWNNVDGFKEFWINAWETIKQWCSDAIEAVKEKFNEWGENINTFITETIPNFINGVGEWFSQLPERIGTWLTTTIDNISTWCSETWTMFIDWCTNVINSVGEWFAQLPERIGFALGFALGTIATWCVDSWNYLATNVPLWIEAISTWFSELPGKIWNWLVETYNKVVQWGSNMWNKAMEIGTQFVETISTWLSQLPGKIWNWLVNAYNKAVQWGSQMYQKAVETGTRFVNAVNQFFSQLPGKVWNWLLNTIDKAAQFVSQMWQKGKEAAQKFGDAVVNGLKSIPGKVVSIGKSIVEGLWTGIKNSASWLHNQISSFANGVINGFKSAFKINSPSKIMRDKIGVGIVEGIDVGIRKEQGSLLRTAGVMADTLVDTMTPSISPSMFSMAKELSSSMTLGVERFKQPGTVGQDFSGKQDMQSLGNIITEKMNDVLAGVLEHIDQKDVVINLDGETLAQVVSPLLARGSVRRL